MTETEVEVEDISEEEKELSPKAPERTGPATAEEIWPYVDPLGRENETPDFEEYLHWLALMEHRKQLLAGLNMPRTFVPRPYQVEGAIWLRGGTADLANKIDGLDLGGWGRETSNVAQTRKGGRMVYDQPGLGKTLQASMALTTPCIIACPGYLVDQWC